MSWNEPGGGNKGPRDPWGGGNQGPPDLDEAFKKLQKQLAGMFGGGRGGSGPAKGGLSGALLGMVALERIPERGFTRSMQVLAALAALNLLL